MNLLRPLRLAIQWCRNRWSPQEQLVPFPQLNLDQYVALLRTVPLPTEQQRANFVDYVAHLHSWYKHLSPNLPGLPFYFYLDPDASCGVDECHHNHVPNEQYTERFGHLDFCGRTGTTIRRGASQQGDINREATALVRGPDGELWDLPAEVDAAGLAHLTSAMHTWQAHWQGFWRVSEWPEESGGQAVLAKILARDPLVSAYGGAPLPEAWHLRPEEMVGALPCIAQELRIVDAELYRLFAPEQRRQHALMRQAIDRVCALVEAQRAAATAA